MVWNKCLLENMAIIWIPICGVFLIVSGFTLVYFEIISLKSISLRRALSINMRDSWLIRSSVFVVRISFLTRSTLKRNSLMSNSKRVMSNINEEPLPQLEMLYEFLAPLQSDTFQQERYQIIITVLYLSRVVSWASSEDPSHRVIFTLFCNFRMLSSIYRSFSVSTRFFEFFNLFLKSFNLCF